MILLNSKINIRGNVMKKNKSLFIKDEITKDGKLAN